MPLNTNLGLPFMLSMSPNHVVSIGRQGFVDGGDENDAVVVSSPALSGACRIADGEIFVLRKRQASD